MSVVRLLDIDKFSDKVKEVTSTEILMSKGTYHPDGLFSNEIFGAEGTPERNKTFGFISLNTKVIHPALVSTIKRIS